MSNLDHSAKVADLVKNFFSTARSFAIHDLSPCCFVLEDYFQTAFSTIIIQVRLDRVEEARSMIGVIVQH